MYCELTKKVNCEIALYLKLHCLNLLILRTYSTQFWAQRSPAQQQFIPSVSSRLETQFLTPFTIRKCCVGNTKANEDFGEAWMFIIALVTLCLKMGITLRSFPRDSAQRRISLESHAKYLAAGGLQLYPIFPPPPSPPQANSVATDREGATGLAWKATWQLVVFYLNNN